MPQKLVCGPNTLRDVWCNVQRYKTYSKLHRATPIRRISRGVDDLGRADQPRHLGEVTTWNHGTTCTPKWFGMNIWTNLTQNYSKLHRATPIRRISRGLDDLGTADQPRHLGEVTTLNHGTTCAPKWFGMSLWTNLTQTYSKLHRATPSVENLGGRRSGARGSASTLRSIGIPQNLACCPKSDVLCGSFMDLS